MVAVKVSPCWLLSLEIGSFTRTVIQVPAGSVSLTGVFGAGGGP
jgi:hypothetical protein